MQINKAVIYKILFALQVFVLFIAIVALSQRKPEWSIIAVPCIILEYICAKRLDKKFK
ncbi:MAG: hypothetical protein K6E79_03065 [Pseudobutyrivibrio sp.]|nr:hypothetical protein [Pseudobutyrivibrio sp.]